MLLTTKAILAENEAVVKCENTSLKILLVKILLLRRTDIPPHLHSRIHTSHSNLIPLVEWAAPQVSRSL